MASSLASYRRHLRAESKTESMVMANGKAVEQLDAFLEREGLPRAIAAIRRAHVEAFLVGLQAQGARPVTVSQRDRSLQKSFKR